MDELLQEYCDSRGATLNIDAAAGVLRSVKLLGRTSRNGREYPSAVLARAASLYEGAKVNINHSKGQPTAPRDYQDRIGTIRAVHLRGDDGLFGDLHFNPKHALAEQLLWDAQHAPHNVGFSHNVQARTVRRNEQLVVEEILSVHSVDLVADPATTRGLFESSTVASPHVNTIEHADAPDPTAHQPPVDLFEVLCREQAGEIQRLRGELDQCRAAEAIAGRRTLARALLSEYRLPDPAASDPAARAIVSESFLHSLVAANDEAAMRSLIQERVALIEHAQRWRQPATDAARLPVSREQALADHHAPATCDSFVRAIT